MKKRTRKRKASPLNIERVSFIAMGGLLLWQNRHQIQRLLKSRGISTPWMSSAVPDAIRSAAAIVEGNVEKEVRTLTHPTTPGKLAKSSPMVLPFTEVGSDLSHD